MTSALSILKNMFGYRAFRDRQQEIVEHVADGGNALVLMPTGGGKSLCFQIPAMMRKGTTIVVSPLIALMQDQVAALSDTWVCAAFLNSSLSAECASDVEGRLSRGEYDLLYVAPERLMAPSFLSLLDKLAARKQLALFAIDEAHCVSHWGHDFRPEYLRLSALPKRFPQVPRIALTATADELTRADIVRNLQLEDALTFVSSFDRPNIRYQIVEKANVETQLLTFLRTEHEGHAGVVYCLTREKVEETAAYLVTKGIRALPYHAGMKTQERNRNQEIFLREDGVVTVATIAFGMGIDKPNVRFVAHIDLPKSIENYYQETGRAGRDGLAADAWMAYSLADVVRQRRFIEQSKADKHHKQLLADKLDAMLGLCETPACRRVRLLAYFGENCAPCGNCDTCCNPPSTMNGTVAVRKALTCAYLTGERFSSAYVIRILMGTNSDCAHDFENDVPDVSGSGADISEAEWLGIFRQMFALGLIEPNHHNQSLRLTEIGHAVRLGKQGVALRRMPPRRSQRKEPVVQVSAIGEPMKHDLWERLRAWRSETAKTHGVPIYRILDDMTLLKLARERPQTYAALGQVQGVGHRQLESYGDALLELLAPNRCPSDRRSST